MPFPASPTNGATYLDTTTNRLWKFYSSVPAWRIEERDFLNDYTRTSSTPAPVDGDELVLDPTAVFYRANSTALGPFEERGGFAAAPLPTDDALPGFLWHDTANADAYLAGVYTPPSTGTTHDTGSTATGSYTVNGGQGIAQSFTITQTATYNRFTFYVGTTDTMTFTFYLINGADANYASGPVLMQQTFTNITVSPGANLLSFTNTPLTAGQTVTWVILSAPINNPVAIRRGNIADPNVLAPVIGTNIVHSATLIGLNQDWGFQFGYDNPTGYTDWVKVGYVEPTLPARVWRNSYPPPLDVMPDGMMWHDTTNGRTFIWDLDALAWVQV
jgi:hypothetical protein